MNPWTDLVEILIGEPSGTAGMFLAWFRTFKLSGLTFIEKTEGKAGFPNYYYLYN